MVLQSKVVVMAVRRGEVDETVQRETEALSIQEVRRREGWEVEIRHVTEAGERVASQEWLCCGKSNVKHTGAQALDLD